MKNEHWTLSIDEVNGFRLFKQMDEIDSFDQKAHNHNESCIQVNFSFLLRVENGPKIQYRLTLGEQEEKKKSMKKVEPATEQNYAYIQ